ncbi:hypothetical protein MRX96_000673 [Rhipicephalus microplus]
MSSTADHAHMSSMRSKARSTERRRKLMADDVQLDLDGHRIEDDAKQISSLYRELLDDADWKCLAPETYLALPYTLPQRLGARN